MTESITLHQLFYVFTSLISFYFILGSFTLQFGLKYEMIYQLDAIECLFVFFQLDMFWAYTFSIPTKDP